MAGCAVANALVIWEIFEFFMDHTFDFNMQKDGIQDTMEDIIVGKAGCVVGMAYIAILHGGKNGT